MCPPLSICLSHAAAPNCGAASQAAASRLIGTLRPCLRLAALWGSLSSCAPLGNRRSSALAITQYANLERRNPMRKLFTLPLVAVALVLCTWTAPPLGRISSSQPFERHGVTV